MNINFEKLTEENIPLIHIWLNTDDVIKGYSHEPTSFEENQKNIELK